MKRSVAALLILLFAHVGHAGPGEEAYHDGDLESAKRLYEERLGKEPDDLRARYNLGNVHYRAEDLAAAEEAYRASLHSEDSGLRSRAAHNLGNVRLQGGEFEGAIQSYRNALIADPGNADSRYNLELALRLKETTPPQPSEGESSEESPEGGEQNQESQAQPDPESEQQQEESQAQPHESGEEETPSESQPSPGEQEEEPAEQEESSAPEPSPDDYTKEEAERVLDGLAEEERELQKERLRSESRNRAVEKDW